MKLRHLMGMLMLLAMTAARSEQQENATAPKTAATETVYLNGRIYTQDKDLPWAQSIITIGDKIVFVGSTQDALQYAAGDSRRVDLKGQFVIPGIIDAHTPPGLISMSGDLSGIDAAAGENEKPSRPIGCHPSQRRRR